MQSYGNTLVDTEANDALDDPFSNFAMPYTD